MEERFDYDGLLGVNSDLREQLADEREKVKGQTQRAEYAEGKVRELLLKQDALELKLSQLQALVRALPEMFGTIKVEQISQTGTNCALFDAGGWIATVDGESVAKALQSLLQYRAALDATPTERGQE